MREDGPSGTLTAKRAGRAHRLYLAVTWVTFLEGAAAKQERTFPGGPERDPGLAKFFNIECVNALGRRQGVHALQVFIQQRADVCAGEVVDFYLHRQSGSLGVRFNSAGHESGQLGHMMENPVGAGSQEPAVRFVSTESVHGHACG